MTTTDQLNCPIISPRDQIVDDQGRPVDWFVELINNLTRRTGGTNTNAVAIAAQVAAEASAQAAQANAGVTIPVEGGTITLNPTNPLSQTALSSTTARINVAQHTRTPPGVTINAGSVNVAERGVSFTVFYNDPGGVGGTVTFEATRNLADISEPADKIIGSIAIQPAPPPSTGGGGGTIPPWNGPIP